MKAMAVQINTDHTRTSESRSPLVRSKSRWTAGLLVIGGAALVCALTGFAMVIESAFGFLSHGLSVAATVLISISFPLLFIAGHCLDKVDEADKAIRLEQAREQGFKEDR